jgi:protein SCO1
MIVRPRQLTPIFFLALTACLCSVPAPAQQIGPPPLGSRTEPLPPELEGVGVTEHLNAQIPLDLEFTDEDGRSVSLREYFQGRQPVILNLGYYRCPMLCSLITNGLLNGMRELNWTPGQEFRLVTVSIDPLETPVLAKLKKQNYIQDYGRPSAAAGWHFLTGKEPAVKALAETVGFGYRWNAERKEYAHPAVLFVCTPEGKISRYLYGVEFPTRTLRLSLVEASQGKIGSTLDRVILYCFHYDADARRYTLAAMNIMRAGGALTVLLLASVLIPLWIRDSRRGKGSQAAA